MRNDLWMRPALQMREAVLLPALPSGAAEDWNLEWQPPAAESPFRPVPQEGMEADTMQLSTYVRPRGSMAGRGVLRAAGVPLNPYAMGRRFQYAQTRRRTAPMRRWPAW